MLRRLSLSTFPLSFSIFSLAFSLSLSLSLSLSHFTFLIRNSIQQTNPKDSTLHTNTPYLQPCHYPKRSHQPCSPPAPLPFLLHPSHPQHHYQHPHQHLHPYH